MAQSLAATGSRVCPTTSLGPVTHTLSILGVTCLVKEYEGAWWKGCCLRPRTQRAVLQNISLHIQSGQLTAILGNSGSGKTSLLDVISCRSPGQVIGGVYMDNKLLTEELFTEECGYVMQDDHLLPNLTVKETLTYTATLKFANAHNMALIKERVDEVLIEMGLRHVENNRIGGTIVRGVSGGEKRRVSIAVQLLQDPKVLLLDEPTSGLDSFTASYLVSNLADLAKKRHKIIAMTIHQPRSEIFSLFDNVTLLSLGELVYMGPSEDLVSYFTSNGYPCPTYSNPLDHYVDIASVDRRDPEQEDVTTERVTSLKMAYVYSPSFRNCLAEIHDATRMVARTTFSKRPWHSVSNPPGFYFAFSTLLRRMMVNLARDRSSFAVRTFQLPLFSLFMWLFLFRLQHNQESIQDRNGLMYQSVQVPAYVGLLNCVAMFPSLRDLYFREARDGLYSGLVFLLAYFVHILPFQIVSSFLFSTMVYWSLGLYPDAGRYGIYSSVVLIMHYAGEILGVVFMGVFNNPAVANSTTALILALAGLLSSGFLRSIQNMLVFFQYLGYLNLFKYSSEILVANEFHELELTCSETSTVPCLFPNGDVYLNVFYPGAVDNIASNFGACSGFIGGFIILAFIVFKVRGIHQLH